ncbi:MAG: ATP synthase F0 subunit C [Myxococcales bacterium]|nr:ATP synthase F0 subunit C [Myxococcales bacterium]
MTSRITKKIAAFTTFLVTFGFASVAFAQGESATALAVAGNAGIISLAAGIAIGMAALGAALGQGRAAAAALDGIARNPGAKDAIFTPMIIALALMEALVIIAFVALIVLLR